MFAGLTVNPTRILHFWWVVKSNVVLHNSILRCEMGNVLNTSVIVVPSDTDSESKSQSLRPPTWSLYFGAMIPSTHWTMFSIT